MQLREDVPLAPLTTLRLGGPARYFVQAEKIEEVRDAIAFAHDHALQVFVLGGGSNLVVADSGFPGLVLKIGLRGIEHRVEDGQQLFTAAAGEDWDSFVAYTVAANCAGVECMSGIPGTVGATPVQNVGAYGQEVAGSISEVQTLDLESGKVRAFCGPACEFGYRTSIFNTTARGQYIILGVTFTLEPGGAPAIAYTDLKRFFAGRAPTLAETREAVRQIRASKAMLLVAGDEDCRSAGSFFKNPVLDAETFQQLRDRLASQGAGEVPNWPAANGKIKVSAAWLVERAGFPKGFTSGAAGISRKHALAIVNRGDATAAEVIALKNDIQAAVRERFAVALHPEPVFLGF